MWTMASTEREHIAEVWGLRPMQRGLGAELLEVGMLFVHFHTKKGQKSGIC